MIFLKIKSTLPKLGILFFLCFLFYSDSLMVQANTLAKNSLGDDFSFTEIGRWAIEGVYALDVTIDGDLAYVCTSDYLAILDISDPVESSLLGSFNEFGNYLGEVPRPEQVLAFGDYIFVIAYWHDNVYCWTNKIMVLDVSDPTNPLLVQEFNVKRLIYDIRLVDNFLYVASSGDFRIYDVEHPNSPYLIGNFSANGFSPSAIAIYGSYAFLGSYGDGYLVLDISSLANPIMVKNCTDFSITRIHFEDSHVFALTKPAQYGSSNRNFTVFNLINSLTLVELNHITFSEENYDFIYSDGYVYFKTYSFDFCVLDATNLLHLEFLYQSNEEELDAQGFSIVGNDFYLAAGADGLIIYRVNYPPITLTINQSIFIIFFIEVLIISVFLKRKTRRQ